MAIIYTYPTKAIPNNNDLILISDSQDSNNTKQVAIGDLPGVSGVGVSSVTSDNAAITIADPTTTPVLTSTAYTGTTNIGHVPTGGSATTFLRGDGSWVTPTDTTVSPSIPLNSIQFNSASSFGGNAGLIFSTPAGVPTLTVGETSNDVNGIIEIQGEQNSPGELKIGGGSQSYYTSIKASENDTASYSIVLPTAGPGSNNKILESNSSGKLSWITTPSGSSNVSITADNGSTTWVDIQVSPSPITGTGTISAELSATGGGAGSDKMFLGYDNTWKIPTSFGNITSSVDNKITGSRNNTDNAQTTNGIIELSNEATSAYGFQANIDSNSKTTGASRHIIFRYNDAEIGFIRNASANSVAYSTSASDERKKKNIVNWDDKILDSFSLIEPKKFNYLNESDSDELTKGFIAQQMVDKFPEAYPKDPDTESQAGYYSFNPSGMTVYLMKAVKELKEEIDALENRIKTLEG